jgi:dCMP deaminase
MIRPSREQCLMDTAAIWAKRSTCMRRAVGAVVAVDNRIVSIGYNGAPPGQPHCIGDGCATNGACTRAIHAEANAIRYVPRDFEHISKHMFTTESPCIVCAAMIVEFRFSAVYYSNEYRLDAGIKHLLRQGMSVYRMTPAGIIAKKSLVNDNLVEHWSSP